MNPLHAVLAPLIVAVSTQFPAVELQQVVAGGGASAALLAIDRYGQHTGAAAGAAVPTGYFRIGSVTKTAVTAVFSRLYC